MGLQGGLKVPNDPRRALENALREARKAWSLSARLPLCRVQVHACADDIQALTRRRRDDRPIDVASAAMGLRLVFDGTSPLYRDGLVSLRHAPRSARLAVDPIELTVEAELA